ncbi:fasciclin domain-containing protein [Corynebacterium alimapuense]|uniref:Fasciclin n=1 Tax=Corynebacterium alimapuense TaxID=1576874 RepID=A0A3M8K8D4_9CORY|nr:fasciclin domain-containing protein [Corynebacterium alimapuense]RNE48812.1 fasciclin [Corynebacterium alimapuense]
MKRTIAAAGAITLALTLAACADDTSEDSTESSAMETTMMETTTEEMASEEMTTEESMDDMESETMAAEATGDIVETAVAAGDFTTLVAALEAADLVETLQGPGPFTVFAPTDEAFEMLPEGTLDELLADPTGDLAEILKYHVVPGEVMAADVVGMDGEMVETVQGGEVTVVVDGEQVGLMDAAGNTVNVVQTDIATTNGVIHVIDAVLSPTA